jgi:hypothetical protein
LLSAIGCSALPLLQVVAPVWPQSAVAFIIRPLPPHFLQGAGKILRPGRAGCFTFGNPVPSQASHFLSRGNVVFMHPFLNKIPAVAWRLVLLGEKPELSVTRRHRNITALILPSLARSLHRRARSRRAGK